MPFLSFCILKSYTIGSKPPVAIEALYLFILQVKFSLVFCFTISLMIPILGICISILAILMLFFSCSSPLEKTCSLYRLSSFLSFFIASFNSNSVKMRGFSLATARASFEFNKSSSKPFKLRSPTTPLLKFNIASFFLLCNSQFLSSNVPGVICLNSLIIKFSGSFS